MPLTSSTKAVAASVRNNVEFDRAPVGVGIFPAILQWIGMASSHL